MTDSTNYTGKNPNYITINNGATEIYWGNFLDSLNKIYNPYKIKLDDVSCDAVLWKYINWNGLEWQYKHILVSCADVDSMALLMSRLIRYITASTPDMLQVFQQVKNNLLQIQKRGELRKGCLSTLHLFLTADCYRVNGKEKLRDMLKETELLLRKRVNDTADELRIKCTKPTIYNL